jgi:hypothetical protein
VLIYQLPPPLDKLEQGDILQKSEALEALLTKYHPHYAQHPDNKFFTVLTQSCDLVPRSGGCSARYISLAPVRPLKVVLKREFDGKLENIGPGAQPFAPHRVRTSFEQFLQRLFNNNEPPFFYFEAAHQSGIYEEMCAMLALPISLKPEHYDTLRTAKLAGISDVFQAKLGWLIGQMYSRVGTPDFEPATLSEKVKAYTEGIAVWLEDSDAKALRGLVAQHGANPGRQELASMISQIPKRKNLVINSVLEVAASQGLFAAVSPERRNFRRALEKDPTFAALF